jgi:hypothetical protein
MHRFCTLRALGMLLMVGCGSSGATPPAPSLEPAPAPAPIAPTAPAPPEAPTAPPTDRIDDPTFELSLTPTGPYSATKLGSFALTLKPRGIYHINQEYPVALSVHPTAGLSFPKAEMTKKELAQMGEKLARFDVPFTAEKPGAYHVEAQLRFAVCTPDNCVPDERTLALELSVQ